MDPTSGETSHEIPLPASRFLQERLQERRARSARPKRARQSDFGPRPGRDDDIFLAEAEQSRYAAARMYDSSPFRAASTNGSEAGGSSHRPRRSLGVKDMDEQMDRLSKQNFALKLELDHRREHTVKLQERLEAMHAQIERAEQVEEEHAELLRINEQMVLELEKRDRAIAEATDIICDLEDKVRDAQEPQGHTRPSTANADSGYAGTETHEQVPPSSPPESKRVPGTPNLRQPPPNAAAASTKLSGVVNGQIVAPLPREPSFLSQKKPSTHTLRSVYLESAYNLHSVKSFNSLLSKRGSKLDGDGAPDDVLNSPRLSVLSESSFPSLYSPKQQMSPDRHVWETQDEDESPESPRAHLRQDSIIRVSRWMSDGDVVEGTPSKSNRITAPLSEEAERSQQRPVIRPSSNEAHFQSLNDALSAASTATAQRPNHHLQSAPHKPNSTDTDKQRAGRLKPPQSIGGPIFGEPLLPPTPDSASTRMLRASRSSIMDERSLLDTTPAAVKGYNPLEPGLRTAPKQMRSSIELNGAYDTHMQYRIARHPLILDDDSEDESDGSDVDADARSETVKDLSLDYNGFPDGNSILNGTPSRFLKHSRAPAADMLFDGNDVSPPRTGRSPPRRRQSSSEVAINHRKPSLGRADTSPTFLGTLGRMVTSGSRSTVASTAITSPRSTYSGSSGDRTIKGQAEHDEVLSPPERNPAERNHSSTRVSASPARTLSQRTQKLFRRMSNSHSEPRSPREKSPLPNLTSVQSSVYVTNAAKDKRRPSTSEARLSPPMQRPLRSREERRPSLQARTQTEPTNGRATSVTAVTSRVPYEKETRNPFKRSDSMKKSVDGPALATEAEMEPASSGPRGGLVRRRGSIREAVHTRRPWR